MIYVISGMVRAGTSMMAEALKQGGIPLLYDETVPNTDPEDNQIAYHESAERTKEQ